MTGGAARAWARRLLLCLLAASGGGAAAAGPRFHAQTVAPPPAPAAVTVPAAQPVPVERQDAGVAAGADPRAANVSAVALRHSAEGLRKTYLDRQGRRKDGMQLPRIIVFNREGRLLGGQGGFRTGDMRHLRRLVHEDKPFPRAADLDDTLAELETPDGAPVLRADLPAADVFLVLYRSAACDRCDRLDAELAVVLRSLHRHRFAWLQVESDPSRIEAVPAAATR